MAEPQVKEAMVSVSVGGKIQLVKFEASSDFGVSFSRRYDIPADWTEDQVDKWQDAKAQYLRDLIEERAQAEVDALLKQKEELNA